MTPDVDDGSPATRHPLRTAVEGDDWTAVEALLHPDVRFRSPAVHAPYEGRAAVMHLLGHAKRTFEGFRYIDQLAGGEGSGRVTTGLVFRASVGGRELEGWDYVTEDGDGLITDFAVMVRPLSGLIALAEAMGARLQADPVPAATG